MILDGRILPLSQLEGDTTCTSVTDMYCTLLQVAVHFRLAHFPDSAYFLYLGFGGELEKIQGVRRTLAVQVS